MEYALGGVVLCGLAYLLMSILVYFLGADKITNIFPPVITGSISIALGLSLASHAIGLASSNWLLAVITLLIIVIINVYCKGFTKLLSIIISLILVYLLSIILTTVNIATLVDFSQVNKATWFGIPQFTVAKFNVETFMLVLPYAICAIVDHIGDVIVVGETYAKTIGKLTNRLFEYINEDYKRGNDIVIVPILRAGESMSNVVADKIPEALVVPISMRRNLKTLKPFVAWSKFEEIRNPETKKVIITDPALETGGSILRTLDFAKKYGIRTDKIIIMSMFGDKKGIDRILQKYPDVNIYLVHMADGIREDGYLLPYNGDTGDRLYGVRENEFIE